MEFKVNKFIDLPEWNIFKKKTIFMDPNSIPVQVCVQKIYKK